MGVVSDAVEAELAALGAPDGALPAVARLLAGRLDAGPSDREVPALTRELRLVLAELRGRAGLAAGEVEEFLASVAAEGFGAG